MTQQHDRRLIEDSMPLEAISFQSAREKSIRHGHISTLHIWWARRPLAAMRAAIFAALMPAPKDDKEREEMHQLIGGTYNAEKQKWEGGICDWDSVKNGNNSQIEQAQELIRKHYPDGPPKVLDPFMGGGSTGLEALRLGCEAHGVELNPVAHIIELCTLVYPQKYGQPMPRAEYEARPGTLPPAEQMAAYVDDDSEEGEGELAQQSLDFDSDEMINPLAEDVKRWGHWVLEEARKEIGHLYEDPMGHKIVGYLWARTSKCVNPSCGAEMPLLKSYWLSKKKVIYLHPIIDKQQKHVQFVIRQGLQEETNPNDATISRSSATCLVCGSHITADEIQEQGNKEGFGEKLVAIIYEVKGETGKRYREVSKQDISIYESVHDEISKREITFPNDELPYLRSIFNVQIYGYDEWGKLFNNRQGLGLSVFANIICTSKFEMLSGRVTKDYADVIVTYLTMAFDRLVDQSATLVTWIYQIEAISHVFTRQALGMIWDYAESNMFNDGGGGFASGIGWVIRTIKKTSQTADTSAILHRGDAARLPYDNAKFDAVVTDPPYYDAVPYADLSDFFYVWMKQILGEIYPDIFATPLSPKSTEIVQIAERNPKYAHKDKAFYEKQMTTSFSEMQRVSVSNGISVVVFAHKSTSAWETLINGLLGSDLVITASWPLNTERTMRLRAQNSGALASSIFIVCRPRNANLEGVYDDVRTRIQARIRERLAFFWKEGIRGADFFISAIGPAVEVFGQYKTVRKLSGDVVTVAELLDIVQYEVADYALSQVMNGGASFGPFDAATRFYIMYRWSYGGNKIEFDDGMRMAMALGAEVDDLMRPNSILKKNGSSVQLLGPSDREKNEHLGEPGRDRMSAPLIDRAHRAALLWRSGQREELRRFVSENVGIEVEALRAVAQALVNVLPDGDKEKQLYEGFLQGELPTMPQSDQMFGDEDF